MKPDYDKLLESMRVHGYEIISSGQDKEFFVVIAERLYFTGADFYWIGLYAEESRLMFDGFFVESAGKGLSVKLLFVEYGIEESNDEH